MTVDNRIVILRQELRIAKANAMKWRKHTRKLVDALDETVYGPPKSMMQIPWKLLNETTEAARKDLNDSV